MKIRTNHLSVCFDVLHVLALRRLSDVAKAIVGRLAIDVVNVMPWKCSRHVKPRQPVAVVTLLGNTDGDIAIRHLGASTATPEELLIDRRFYPSKKPCFWAVVENFAQAVCAKIGLSHDAPYQRIGQRPSRVCSTSGLRHFSVSNVCWGGV